MARSSTDFEFSDDGELVYFTVNVKELFKVSLNYPGMRSAVKQAFKVSKNFVPVDTGLMKKSYTLKYINKDVVMCVFDPQKIVGSKRGKYTVKTYYPKYLKDTTKRWNWLDIIMKHFYSSLVTSAKSLEKKDKKGSMSLIVAAGFLTSFMDNYNDKLKKERADKVAQNRSGK